MAAKSMNCETLGNINLTEFLCFPARVLCLLPGPDLGPGATRVQMHPVQATGAQEVPQAGAEAVLQRARGPCRSEG